MKQAKKILSLLLALMLAASLLPLGGAPAYAAEGETTGESYTVSFDSAGGSPVANQSVKSGETAKAPAAPTREGYVFAGWFTEQGEAFAFETPITGNRKLTAKWTEEAPPAAPEEPEKKQEEAPAAPEEPEKKQEEAPVAPEEPEKKQEESPVTPTEPEKQQEESPAAPTEPEKQQEESPAAPTESEKNPEAAPAEEEETKNEQVGEEGQTDQKEASKAGTACTVTFDAAGGSDVDPQEIEKGGKASKPEDPARAGYVFEGWYTGSDCADGDEFDFATEISDSMTLYAKWAEAYTVSFVLRGKDATGAEDSGKEFSESVKKGESLTIPDCPFTPPTGQSFCYWLMGDEPHKPGTDFTPSKDASMVPWYGVALSYDANGGKGEMDKETVEAGSAIKLPECGFKAPVDRAFDHWEIDGKSYAPGDGFVIQSDSTAKAVWKATSYKVTFSVNGHGTAPKTQKVPVGGKASKPADPAAKGYVFGGWYSNILCTKPFKFSTEITADTTLYAKWTAVRYDFVSGGYVSWYKSSGSDLKFTVKRNLNDSETYGRFVSVEVDGKKLSSSDYKVEAGSLKLTLKNSYLKGLSRGLHRVTVNFDDGYDFTSFSVRTTVRTGDDSQPGLFAATMLLSALGAAAVLPRLRRGRREL